MIPTVLLPPTVMSSSPSDHFALLRGPFDSAKNLRDKSELNKLSSDDMYDCLMGLTPGLVSTVLY